MALFNCFVDEYHQVRFNNLYIAAKFALRSFQHKNKMMIEGVTRTGGRGIPQEILQTEVMTKDLINANKGTVKVVVLEDCTPLSACPLVAASVYDTKPIHLLSMCCDELKWVKKACST